jgi:hypothetical protein
MATVKLYFEPYPENDADGLVIEESADGLSDWVEIEDIPSGSIGTYPNWISSFTTSNAADVDYWFRIAWKVGGVVQNYSDPLQVGDLAPKYTVPDLIRETTRLTALIALGTIFIQEMITQAYRMVQNACGPFNETDVDFIEIAPLAMRLYVEYLFVTQDPDNLSALTGMIEEKVGSYRYRRSEKAVEMYSDAQGEVPDNIKALMCPYAAEATDAVEVITTAVFPETPWYDGEETDLDKKKVYTAGDAMRLAIDIPDPYRKYPSN